MKTILAALLVAVGLLNALVLTARTGTDRAAADQHTLRLEADLAGMRRQIANLEANAQTAGSFRRMSVAQHRRFEAQAEFANGIAARYDQQINAAIPTAP